MEDHEKKCWNCLELTELMSCRIHQCCPVWLEDEEVINCTHYITIDMLAKRYEEDGK